MFDHQCLLTVRRCSSPSSHDHFRLADWLSQGMALEVREKVGVKWALISPANRTVCVFACTRLSEWGCVGVTS